MGRFVVAVVALGLALAPAAGAAERSAKDETLLVSRAGIGGPGGDGSSSVGSLSADGRVVGFGSFADDLHPADADAFADVFTKDMATGAITLVSRADGPAGAPAAGGPLGSFSPMVSGDGAVVAFQSRAANLSAENNDAYDNVYVRDVTAGTTRLVSRATGAAGVAANNHSAVLDLDSAGRVVLFATLATNLGAVESGWKLYVRDLVMGTTALVARDAFDGDLSANGRYVVFGSGEDALSPDDDDAVRNVFRRDRLTGGTIVLVSRAPDGGAADEDSSAPSVSDDGTRVAFASKATNLSAGDDDAAQDVFVRDLAAGTTTWASRDTGGPAVDAYRPAIAPDGRRVAWDTDPNTTIATSSPRGQVLLRDLVAGTTAIVSRQSASLGGAIGNDDSYLATFSGDGRYLGFTSWAQNFSLDDLFGADAWLRDLDGPPVVPVPPGGGDPPPGGGDPPPAAGDPPPAVPATPGGGTPVPPVPGAGPDRRAPRITTVRLSRRAFVPARKRTALRSAARGTTVRYGLTEAARVTFAVHRRTKRGWERTGPSFVRAGSAGANRTAFTGRLGRRALRPGRHKLVLTAVDAAGNRSRPVARTFSVRRR